MHSYPREPNTAINLEITITTITMIAPILRTLPRAARRVQTPMAARNFQTTTFMRARKDAQDKDSIDRSSIEYSRSGTDGDVAQNEEASFDPKTTRPEQELEKAGEGNEVCYPSFLVLQVMLEELWLQKAPDPIFNEVYD